MGGPIFQLINAVSAKDWYEAITWAAVIILVLLVAFPLHELFHALAADRLGDSTPRDHGRITLNPFKQLSLLGSVLFLVVGFGWASVPINNANFGREWRQKAALVALAGPSANLLLAILFGLIYRGLGSIDLSEASLTTFRVVTVTQSVMAIGVSLNTFLCIFNLLPVPPLDGARAFVTLLPEAVEPYFAQFQRFGILILLAISQTGLLNIVVSRPANTLAMFLLGRSA